jgi:hypothetical protein
VAGHRRQRGLGAAGLEAVDDVQHVQGAQRRSFPAITSTS